MGEICDCIEDRPKYHVYKMEKLRGIAMVTFIYHWISRGATHGIEIHQTIIGTRNARLYLRILKERHPNGKLYGRAKGSGEVLGGVFGHI